MKPYLEDDGRRIYCGDALDVLPGLEAEFIQCVVTSPPYWGLRKYEGEQERVWGGTENCEHEWGSEIIVPRPSNPDTGLATTGTGAPETRLPGLRESGQRSQSGGAFCQLCGAWRGAYGLEPTPELYVEHTVEYLRAIRRVLRKDGVVFWNIGDSYAGSMKGVSGDKAYGGPKQQTNAGSIGLPVQDWGSLKSKDLVLIPFRVALAAQADGWWVRSVIIWSKPNPMPESVKDRPTNSHEYILMLTKSGSYYWDQDAVREPARDWGIRDRSNWSARVNAPSYGQKPHMGGENGNYAQSGRNLRSVWEFPTQPYPEAHFAVFPTELPRRCIKAATSEKGNCSGCGKPWVRVVERKRTEGTQKVPDGWDTDVGSHGTIHREGRGDGESGIPIYENVTTGWQPQCACYRAHAIDPFLPPIMYGVKPDIVLDPFSGSGTTIGVARSLGRYGIAVDTSEQYCQMAIARGYSKKLAQRQMPL